MSFGIVHKMWIGGLVPVLNYVRCKKTFEIETHSDLKTKTLDVECFPDFLSKTLIIIEILNICTNILEILGFLMFDKETLKFCNFCSDYKKP